MTESGFKLSEPGSSVARDPAVSEYLRSYELPDPPSYRYGFHRFDSPGLKDRVNLFGQAWVPEHAIGTVLLLHGYCEHSGNYASLIKDFLAARFAVAALDLRGHGLSEGPRGHVEHPTSYAEDVETFVNSIAAHLLPHRPLFLWGHSLGGLVALQLLLRKNLNPSAIVLSSPLLGFPEMVGRQKLLAGMAPIMARLFPSVPINHGLPPEILSHDEEYLARRFDDPLIGLVSTPLWLVNIHRAIDDVQENAKEYLSLCPTMVLLAGDEKVTNLNAARKFAFYAYASLKHKVVEFPGYYHELEKERVIRPKIVSESIAWMKNHSS